MQSVAITTDKDNRHNFKDKLLNKVKTALIPPAVEEEVIPEEPTVEIIDKYSTWVPARLALASEELLPDFKKDEAYIPQHEVADRASLKNKLLNKVEESLIPVELVEPTPIEIIDRYSNWTPARLSLEPQEVLSPEFKTETSDLFPREIEKRASLKKNLLNKVEVSLNTPARVEEEPVTIEIIDKYTKWVPAGFDLQPEEAYFPEGKKDELFISLGDKDKRETIKHNLLDKVEEALIPVDVIEPDPIEILDKHRNWAPARILLEPQDDLSPEFKIETPDLFPREIEKRISLKQSLLNKVETALETPAFIEIEPTPIEIIEKFSSGIPQPLTEDDEPIFSDNRIIVHPVILAADIPKRTAFKETLVKKIGSLPVVEEISNEPVEIVGEYSQRTVTPYGLDFEEVKIPTLAVSELQKTIEDFKPVDEDPVVPVLRLPENYSELDDRALYGLLIRNTNLQHTAETANLAMDVLSGRSTKEVEFLVVEEPQPVKKTVVKKAKVAAKELPMIEAPVIKPKKIISSKSTKILEPFNFDLPSDWTSIPLSTLRTDLLSTGATPEQVDAKMEELISRFDSPMVDKPAKEQFTVDLPEEFSSWKPNSQYLYLIKERLLTPEQANEVIWEINK